MLNLFKKKIVLGDMSFIFPDHLSVFTSDSIPRSVPGAFPEIVCDLWFSMMFVGKLLNNFPGSSGSSAVQDALGRLGEKCANDQTNRSADSELFSNVSLLGLFLPGKLEFLTEEPGFGKLYKGTFFKKGDNYLVETKIAFGEEDYYHRATLDAMLEIERIKLGDKGSALVTAVGGYLSLMLQNGTLNLAYNLHMAAASAMMAASKVTDFFAPSSKFSG